MPSKYTYAQRIRIFWERVDTSQGIDACWLWTAGTNTDGYGQTHWENGRLDRCHRIAYRLINGEIPNGLCVCHSCDNPLCCNPDHLFLGTHLENMLDRKLKGRDPNDKGEHNPRCKVSDAQVAEIRAIYARGEANQRELGEKYGIGQSQVSHIVLGMQR